MLEKLYRLYDNACFDDDYDAMEKYKTAIEQIEKAERMKDIKISKYRSPDENRMYYFDEIGKV